VVLVTRFGRPSRSDAALPPMLRGVREAGLDVAWVSDPMHGNTETVVPTGEHWAARA
jgi:3-deoxy-7-phosphoheptulonate synthase